MANTTNNAAATVEFTDAPPPWAPREATQPTPPDPRLPYPTIKGQVDYELYKVWREHIRSGLQRNDQMFRKVLNAFMRPYQLTVWMNVIIFTIGVAAFIAAIVLSVVRDQPLYAAIFAGMSAVTFLGFFISRPLRSLEENLEFITWLGMIYNTYWARVVFAMDQQTVQKDLADAIKQSSDEIERLVQRHAELADKRPPANTG
jgi:hypothetical protein